MNGLRKFGGAFTLIEMLTVLAVIAVLMGLLLPALSSAREKGRRAACTANVCQIGLGLEQYLGVYAQYYPCNATGGARLFAEGESNADAGNRDSHLYGTYGTPPVPDVPDILWNDFGMVKDAALPPAEGVTYTWVVGTYIAAGRYASQIPPTLFRNIFLGARDPDSFQPGSAERGQFNLAPVGLGYLLSSGFLGDAHTYFCPSAAAMPARSVDFTDCWWRLYPENVSGRSAAAQSPADLARAGGFDARSVMYGDWSWLGPFFNYFRYTPCRVVLSHYAYRGVPSMVLGGSGSHHPLPNPSGQFHRILHTKPDRMVFPGEPIFKTTKMLEGRAIVSDAFGRSAWHQSSMNAAGPVPGEGYYAHRAGYNVLYGDGHAQWYGDPQQALAWWPIRNYLGNLTDDLQADRDLRFHIVGNHLADAAIVYNGAPHNIVCKGPGYLWHLFDESARIDVGVDATAAW